MTSTFKKGQTVKITWSGVHGGIVEAGPIHSFVRFPDGEVRSYLNTRLTLVSMVGEENSPMVGSSAAVQA